VLAGSCCNHELSRREAPHTLTDWLAHWCMTRVDRVMFEHGERCVSLLCDIASRSY